VTNVLSLNMGADTGGVSWALRRAFENVPGWDLRSLVSMPNYIAYPMDLAWTNPNIEQWWNWADVIHLHNGTIAAERLHGGWKGWRLRHRPYVVQHHGTIFREQPEPHLSEARRYNAVVVVSTLDLEFIAPDEVTWLPNPVDVKGLRAMRKPSDNGRVLIAHAPTNRQIKSTASFLEAVKRLQDEGFPVDLDLIEHTPWKECLARKARADIFFDQVILGYGCNALEAWGMGIPVIAGAADETLDEMERRFGQLPFYHATEETIYDALRELVESPKLRKRYGKIGYDYVRKWHDYPVVVEQLKGIYQRVLGQSMEEAA
jgi:glycosyltransferase involved in cell wall biosynthesis